MARKKLVIYYEDGDDIDNWLEYQTSNSESGRLAIQTVINTYGLVDYKKAVYNYMSSNISLNDDLSVRGNRNPLANRKNHDDINELPQKQTDTGNDDGEKDDNYYKLTDEELSLTFPKRSSQQSGTNQRKSVPKKTKKAKQSSENETKTTTKAEPKKSTGTVDGIKPSSIKGLDSILGRKWVINHDKVDDLTIAMPNSGLKWYTMGNHFTRII